jgi:hypothetical protein
MSSKAYADFLDTLKVAEALLDLERQYTDPPKPEHQKIVEGLRGGANVLMVAAFEYYLKELVEEHLSDMVSEPLKFKAQNVPYKTQRTNIENRLEKIRRMKDQERVAEYLATAQLIVAGVIMVDSFTSIAQNNPNSKNVKELFKTLGIEDFYSRVKNSFDNEWGMPTARTFIEDKLDEIVNSRHHVAHSARILNISRVALQDWLKFFKIIGKICDTTLAAQVQQFF